MIVCILETNFKIILLLAAVLHVQVVIELTLCYVSAMH